MEATTRSSYYRLTSPDGRSQLTFIHFPNKAETIGIDDWCGTPFEVSVADARNRWRELREKGWQLTDNY